MYLICYLSIAFLIIIYFIYLIAWNFVVSSFCFAYFLILSCIFFSILNKVILFLNLIDLTSKILGFIILQFIFSTVFWLRWSVLAGVLVFINYVIIFINIYWQEPIETQFMEFGFAKMNLILLLRNIEAFKLRPFYINF